MATRKQLTTQAALFLAVWLTLALAGCGVQEDAQTDESDQPPFSIRNVTGNLYEARTASHNSVFLATTEGIIISIPCGRILQSGSRASWRPASIPRWNT